MLNKNTSFLLGVVVLCCWLGLCHANSPRGPTFQSDFISNVLHINSEKNFQKVSKHLDFRWLILFYLPNHDLSADLQEVFLEAHDQFNGLNGGELQFAAVDCAGSPNMCKKLKVKLFPAVMYFREGVGEEVYLRTLDDFKAFSDRVTLPDFWETSRPKVVDDAFGKAHYLHPSGGVSMFFIPAFPLSRHSPSPSFLAFSYQASLWKHLVRFYVVSEEEEGKRGEGEESLRDSLLSLLNDDGVVEVLKEDIIIAVRGPESIAILDLDFFEEEEEEFYSSTLSLSSSPSSSPSSPPFPEDCDDGKIEEKEEEKEEEKKEEEEEDRPVGRLESMLQMTENQKKKKGDEGEAEKRELRRRKRLLGERNKKVFGGWVHENRYRIVEKIQPQTANDLMLQPEQICCITFIGDLNTTSDLAIVESRLQSIERAILNMDDLPEELSFAYAFVADFDTLSKKNGVRDNSKLPLTVMVDAINAKHAVLPEFTKNEEKNTEIVIDFLEEYVAGNTRFRPSYYGTFDGAKYLALKARDFVLGQPPIEFIVLLVVSAAGFVFYLCRNYEDMSEREEIVRELMRKAQEEERKKKEEELLKIIEEEEKNIQELLKMKKKGGEKEEKKEGEGEKEEKKEGEGVVEKLRGLVEMKNKGELTDEEFKMAKEALLKSK